MKLSKRGLLWCLQMVKKSFSHYKFIIHSQNRRGVCDWRSESQLYRKGASWRESLYHSGQYQPWCCYSRIQFTSQYSKLSFLIWQRTLSDDDAYVQTFGLLFLLRLIREQIFHIKKNLIHNVLPQVLVIYALYTSFTFFLS